MRKIEDIHGDYRDVATLDGTYEELEAATIRLVNDIPDLLAELEKKEGEIEWLTAGWAEATHECIHSDLRLKLANAQITDLQDEAARAKDEKYTEIERLQSMIDRLDDETYKEIAF